jgi:hypothetical protein
MKHFRSPSLAAALLCLAVSASAGWLWHTLSEATCQAQARVALRGDPFGDGDAPPRGINAAGAHGSLSDEQILTSAVLSAAVDLLRERGVTLTLPSPFDSDADYLLACTRVEPSGSEADDEVRIVCTAPQAEETLQMLTAIVDAFLAAAATGPSQSGASASDDPERERRQLALAVARLETRIAALESEQQNARLSSPGSAGSAEVPGDLESHVAAVRSAVADAEKLLDDARRDFEKQLTAEIVASRLPEGPVRAKILDRLGQARLFEELHQLEALALQSSAIYGRNHPRMVELRKRIGQLQRQIRDDDGAGDPAVSGSQPDPRTIVLQTLEGELADSLADARQIDALQTTRNDRAGTLQKLDTELADARQELAFLHGEEDRMKRQIESARREQARRAPALIDPPTLSPESAGPRAGLQMAVSCVAGMALTLFILWQLRSRLLGPAEAAQPARSAAVPFARAPLQGTVPPGALAPPLVQIPQSFGPTKRRELSRAQDEERLARLKMLSTRGSAAVKWE